MDVTRHTSKIMIAHRGVLQVYSLFIYSSNYQAWWSGCQPLTKVKNPWGEGWVRQTHFVNGKRQLRVQNKNGDNHQEKTKELRKNSDSLWFLRAVGIAGLSTSVIPENLPELLKIRQSLFTRTLSHFKKWYLTRGMSTGEESHNTF